MAGQCGDHATGIAMILDSRPAVYIDGQAGTTALTIYEYLRRRNDIKVIRLPDEQRKDQAARREAIDDSDLTILCLPDDAALEAAAWAGDFETKIIDASTAHRVAESWVYGLPEMSVDARAAIRRSSRVANPGCYPTSVVLLLRPLIEKGIVSALCPLVIHALSGYSGGGRRMMERWENRNNGLMDLPYSAPYATDRVHKHIPEMMYYSGLEVEPQFLPRVGPFPRGMRVELPLHAAWLSGSGAENGRVIWETIHSYYEHEQFVDVKPLHTEPTNEHTFDPIRCLGSNNIELVVCSHPSGHVLLVGILDNLGKGAGGVAIQSMNLMLGFEENRGLLN